MPRKTRADPIVATNTDEIQNQNTVAINLDQNTEQNENINLFDEVMNANETLITNNDELNLRSMDSNAMDDHSQQKQSPTEFRSMITVGSISPRNFDGTGDVDDWIAHFIYTSKCNNWEEQMQKRRIPVHLKGTAEMWYRDFAQLNEDSLVSFEDSYSLAEIFNGLREAFRPKNYRSINQSALSCRLQAMDEPVAQYYYDMLRLCQKMNPRMDDMEKMTHIMRGLKPGMLEKVLVLEPKDCLDLLGKLRSIEEAEFLGSKRQNYNLLLSTESPKESPHGSNSRNSEPVSRSTEVVSSAIESKVDKLCELMLNLLAKNNNQNNYRRNNGNYYQRKPSRTVDGRPICYNCDKPGHVARACPQNPNPVGAITGTARGGTDKALVPSTEN